MIPEDKTRKAEEELGVVFDQAIFLQTSRDIEKFNKQQQLNHRVLMEFLKQSFVEMGLGYRQVEVFELRAKQRAVAGE